MESLLDDNTRQALENMSKPLRDRLKNANKELSDTLVILEKLQTKIKIYLPKNFTLGGYR